MKKIEKDAKTIICTAIFSVTAATLVTVANNEKHGKNEKELLDTINSKQKEIIKMKEEIQNLNNDNKELNKELIDITKQLNDANYIIEKYNAKVSFNEHDVTKVSGTTLSHMQRALKNTELYDDAKSFVKAEGKYGINAYFVAAICANESSWGESNRARNQNNLSGYAVYTNSAKGATFESREESIMATAKLLKETYLTPGAQNFNGYSIVDVNKKYCFLQDQKTIDYNWSSQVTAIASDLVYKANKFAKL